ncbi:globin domain-containing protein [Terriglobus albidus]|uniref:globin domain-containing protein n=1 Tax=Terriglobus albidus TaxID=1592106 RepID=UPI0021E043C5|nr:globin domain-containing protein [Terriglobus albidus]
MTLLDHQKLLVQSTIPALTKHGEEITRVFYQRMFAAHPEVAPMFNQDDQKNGAQHKRLAGAILAYAGNLDRLDLLGPAVSRIEHRHVATKVRPEHYPIVGKYLLVAIQEVLGDAATPEILEAWSVAYNELAQIMIGHEAAIYAEQEEEQEQEEEVAAV